MRIANVTDLLGKRRSRDDDRTIDMDRFAASDRAAADGGWTLLEGCLAWSMDDHACARAGLEPCPICKGGELAPMRYCLGCDRTGLDGKVHFPGLAVDQSPDEDWQDDDVRYYDGRGRRLAG